MLSQRIVNLRQIGLNAADAVQAAARRSHPPLRGNLKTLDAEAPVRRRAPPRAGLRAARSPLRISAFGVIRQADAELIDARAEDVLMAAERLTRALQDQSSAPVSRWVNLAGRQRMLSQRLVKTYMLRQWGVDNARLRDEMESVQNEFSGALTAMQQRADNSAATRGEIENLALQWEWLRTALATEGAESFRLILAEGGDAVLELADR